MNNRKVFRILVGLLILLPLSSISGCAEEKPVITDAWGSVKVRAEAGDWERKAAEDLVRYLSQMTGEPVVLNQEVGSLKPTIVVGELALQSSKKLQGLLKSVGNKKPIVRSDSIALLKDGNTFYLAGNNDDSHYFAASYLLQKLGCRWYMPGEFGECIPANVEVTLPELEYAYSPPFEVRTYWVSWMGDKQGYEEFARRNFFNLLRPGGGGKHALGKYLKGLPEGSALTDPSTAKFVADKLSEKFASGSQVSVGISDAVQGSANKADLKIAGGIEDKYFDTLVWSDVVGTLYNNIAEELTKRHPDSDNVLSFLAYTNVTLPPQRIERLIQPLIGYLAPIDVNPNHPMSSSFSPSRLDYLGAVRRWNEVLEGRLIIYDYDQSMLVWRDVPNPSHHVVKEDVKTYRELGILGFFTESRHAFATTFLNLHFRGQLYWNPDYEIDEALDEFYPKFYGEASLPMSKYWSSIYDAWEKTEVTEHEFFVIPAVYKRQMVEGLAQHISAATSTDLKPIEERRVKFTQLGFRILDSYTAMVESAASDCGYTRAVELGRSGLEARDELLNMDPVFATPASRIKVKGPAWWPGEVELFEQLSEYQKSGKFWPTSLNWSFRNDPGDHGIWRNWAQEDPKSWQQTARTDLYLQAQTSLELPVETAAGFAWYSTRVKTEEKGVHLAFPGLLQEAWLFVDGRLIGHRQQKSLWWRNDYSFLWDVPLDDVEPGEHVLTLRVPIKNHLSGMFRRPFLYKP